MKAIILFQVGNINIALDILKQISIVYDKFDYLTIFLSILDNLNTTPLIDYINYIQQYHSSINYIVISHPNKGMDIGPFIHQMKYLIDNDLHYDLLFKLHTKTNITWKNELIEPLLANINLIKKLLTTKNKIGLIGSSKWSLNQDKLNQQVIINLLNKLNIKNEYFDNINQSRLEYARKNNIIEPMFYITYNKLPITSSTIAIKHFTTSGIYDNSLIPHPSIISKYHTVDTKFIGGTIFWARYDVFFNFFKDIPLYDILYHLLEEKYTINTKGTLVHALERFLCLIVYIMDYEIYSV